MSLLNPIELSKALIADKTITPVKASGFVTLQNILQSLGFACEILTYEEEGHEAVANLYATIGQGEPHLCFAGHMDVVPTGPSDLWLYPPFEPTIKDGILYGRGTSDMKCAIAAFISATAAHLQEHPGMPKGSISLLITGDEEGRGINGTKKMLQTLHERGASMGACIVGEPTSDQTIGDTVKIGRRGSITLVTTFSGKQGHVAYPHLANNPIPKILKFLTYINDFKLDQGNEHFDPSHLEIVRVATNYEADNVIPHTITATFNVRFNDIHTAQMIHDWIHANCDELSKKYDLIYSVKAHSSGEAFVSNPGDFCKLVTDSIKSVTGNNPILSTSGGTSDARFIKDYMPVVELGVRNETAHKIDEHVPVADIEKLTEIYKVIVGTYFK